MFTPLTICWVFKQGKWSDNKIERESLVQLICDVILYLSHHGVKWGRPLCNSLVNVIEHFNELSIYLRTMDVAWAMCVYCLGGLLELEQCLFMSVNVIGWWSVLFWMWACTGQWSGLLCETICDLDWYHWYYTTYFKSWGLYVQASRSHYTKHTIKYLRSFSCTSRAESSRGVYWDYVTTQFNRLFYII